MRHGKILLVLAAFTSRDGDHGAPEPNENLSRRIPLKRLLLLSLTALLVWSCESDSVMAPGDDSLTLASHGTEVVVWPGDMDGWQIQTSGGSTVAFENGPGTPPLGTGSAEFRVDATGATFARLRNTLYHGTPLADLTELEYFSYQEFNQSEQAVYVILNIDLDNDGIFNFGAGDDFLIFEPVYQKAAYGCPLDQGAVLLGVWQDWDALNGCWWSVQGVAGAGPGADVKTLAQYLAAEPDATIVNDGALGGVRLATGDGGPADWGNFIGNADAFSIANGAATVYNFELVAPVNNPQTKDDCKKGGWQQYGFKNQGQCVRFVETGKDSR